MAHSSGYFKTGYAQELALLETRFQRSMLAALIVALIAFPFLVGPFALDLLTQVMLAAVGSVALMLLTGFAGQISLGHAGLMAAGAFTTGILIKEVGAPFWVTLPASGLTGAVLGFFFGLPSLRLKGLYLAMSTLAMHFIVVFVGGEYEAKRGFSTGILVDSPSIGSYELDDPVHWYFVLLVVDILVVLFALNLLRSKTGRAWAAIRDREVAAAVMGISVPGYKLRAFVISSVLTSLAGSLYSYFHGFVSVEAFSLFMTIEFVAMIIIGGMGSLLGAILGAFFVVLFPFLIDWAVDVVSLPARFSTYIFAVKYAAFGVIMIGFLMLEPQGLVGVWHRIRDYFLLWPFRQKPLASRS